ncbi:cob(I)yrinic acid a,c-diamide adenosyltransferase [Thermodesulfobacteriota bacterium]
MPHKNDDQQERPNEIDFGYIHILYGDGVGKTSTATGMALRATGIGLNVYYIQFMKSGDSSELNILKKIPGFHYRCPGRHTLILDGKPEKKHFDHAKKALEYAQEAVNGDAEFLVCDEILNTVSFNILQKEDIMDLIFLCRGKIELVITGRECPDEIFKAGDYVNQFIKKKHPYDSGIKARRGIEY